MLALAAKLPGIESITARGLTLSAGLTLSDYRQQGQFIKACGEAARLWAADWREQGRVKFGALAVEVAEQLSFNLPDTAPIYRSEKLTQEHHFIAAKSPEPEKWLKAAETHDLSPRALKRSIEANEILPYTPTPGGTQMSAVMLESSVMEFQLYARRNTPSKMTTENLNEALRLFAPICAWITEAEAEAKARVA